MRTAKLVATVALLLFVGATVGLLITQEVSQSSVEVAADGESRGTTKADGPSPTESAIAAQSAESEWPSTSGEITANPEGSSLSSCVVDAIYFHNTLRCRTCKKIEETARAALEAEFTDEMIEGRLRWFAINMEQQRHYVDQYELVKPTLILVRWVGDELQDWVALDETWTLIGYESKFLSYVKDSTRASLGGCP